MRAGSRNDSDAKRKDPDRAPARAASKRAITALPLDDLWIAAVLLGAVLIVYFPVIHGGFIWDDSGHVTRPDLRSLHGLWRIWFELGATQQYYPLLHTAFWVEHKLWGDATVGYHLLNILLHAVAVWLLLWILRGLKIPGAALAAAIFALHPVHVESVAWIAEQKNTLSAVFYLGAMLAYLRFDQKRLISLYLLALGLFVLGLLTKTVLATLPAALLIIFWWQRGRVSLQRDVVPLIPWFVLGAAAGLFTAGVERKLIGAEGAAFDLTFLQRCLLAGRAMWFYLGKLIWPVDLVFIYSRWQINSAVWSQYLFPTAALMLVGALWLVRSRWRGPLAGVLFFIASLFPVLGFFNVYPFIFSFVADHFQYLASLGIIVTVSAGVSIVVTRLPLRVRWASQALCVVLVAALAVLTWQRSRAYSDVETLYRTTIASNPNCWMCHNNLGVLLAEAGQLQAATEQFQQDLRIKPDHAEAYYNLGIILAGYGKLDQAIAQYRQALRIDPRYTEAHNNLGTALVGLGQLDEAIAHYRQALRIDPHHAKAHNNLGTALASLGKFAEAIEQFREALEINPRYAAAHLNLGLALGRQEKREEAIEHFREALRIQPEYATAHEALARSLILQGRKDEAIKHLQESVRILRSHRQSNEKLFQQ